MKRNGITNTMATVTHEITILIKKLPSGEMAADVSVVGNKEILAECLAGIMQRDPDFRELILNALNWSIARKTEITSFRVREDEKQHGN